MADFSFTPADVLDNSGNQYARAQAKEAMSAGDAVIRKTDGLYKADSNDSAGGKDGMSGILLVDVAENEMGKYQTAGLVEFGDDVFTPGEIIIVSSNPGKLAPAADVANGKRTIVAGVAESPSALRLGIVRGAVYVD